MIKYVYFLGKIVIFLKDVYPINVMNLLIAIQSIRAHIPTICEYCVVGEPKWGLIFKVKLELSPTLAAIVSIIDPKLTPKERRLLFIGNIWVTLLI